jgi:hypothetical protein
MEIAQGGRCSICGRTPVAPKQRLVVDHCHHCADIDKRGSVRPGLLCWHCNLGKFHGPDAEQFRLMSLWVARHEAHRLICAATPDVAAQQEDRDIVAMAEDSRDYPSARPPMAEPSNRANESERLQRADSWQQEERDAIQEAGNPTT